MPGSVHADDAAFQKRMADALEERVKATKPKKHWEQKLNDENATVEELKRVAEVVQTEFQVCLSDISLGVELDARARNGVPRRSKSAPRLRILANLRLCKGR
jgi:hypothetical protein